MNRTSCQATVALILLCVASASEPGHADDIKCAAVGPTIGKDTLFGMKNYNAISTSADRDVDASCKSGQWSNPLEYWLYGDYDFLYNNYGKKERKGVMGSRDPDYYKKEIKRYSCTNDKGPVGFFAFRLDPKAASGNGELTFLCVPQGRTAGIGRGQGLGFEVFNEALSTAAHAGGGGSVNLTLTALPTAIPFYSSLDINCGSETRDKVTVTEYKTGPVQYSKGGGARVSRRFYLFDTNWKGGQPTYRRINYGCTNKEDYDKFVQLGAEMQHLGERNPFATEVPKGGVLDNNHEKKFADAREEMCHLVEERDATELAKKLCGQ